MEKPYVAEIRKRIGSAYLMVPGGRAILENREGKVLLILRSDFQVWALPGGSPNERESAEDAIIREVREETGLIISEYEAIGFTSHADLEIVTYPNGDQVHGFALVLYATQWQGELKIESKEILSAEFFDPKHPPEMLPNERRSVEKYLEFKRTGKFQVY
jgi:8-oxo-dGTP pyrophosphatase MutT (NUDIX family)